MKVSMLTMTRILIIRMTIMSSTKGSIAKKEAIQAIPKVLGVVEVRVIKPPINRIMNIN